MLMEREISSTLKTIVQTNTATMTNLGTKTSSNSERNTSLIIENLEITNISIPEIDTTIMNSSSTLKIEQVEETFDRGLEVK